MVKGRRCVCLWCKLCTCEHVCWRPQLCSFFAVITFLYVQRAAKLGYVTQSDGLMSCRGAGLCACVGSEGQACWDMIQRRGRMKKMPRWKYDDFSQSQHTPSTYWLSHDNGDYNDAFSHLSVRCSEMLGCLSYLFFSVPHNLFIPLTLFFDFLPCVINIPSLPHTAQQLNHQQHT